MPDIFEEVMRIKRERRRAALATVINAGEGVPGKTGFRMIVYPNGEIKGTVGGGLLEAKVIQESLRCIQEKSSKLVNLELDQTRSGIGVLCGGKTAIFVEPILPNATIFIFGGGHIALPLAQFAKALEFAVVVVDDREEFASRDRFPMVNDVKLGDFAMLTRSIEFQSEDSVVIITHGHEHDETVLRECLITKNLPGYVGMIGSKTKVVTIMSHLKQQGISDELLARVNAPIGLDIGAKTPAEIAISIIAEIIAHKYGKSSAEATLHKQ